MIYVNDMDLVIYFRYGTIYTRELFPSIQKISFKNWSIAIFFPQFFKHLALIFDHYYRYDI